MKTRYFILATLAMALLAVSCQKAAVGGAQEPEEAPVPVQLTTNLKVNSVSVTKAGVDAWAGQKLYIYALPTNTIPDPQTEGGKILVKNAEASAPQNGAAETAYPIDLYDTTSVENEIFYYYPADKTTLDFYGYYVGEAFKDPTQTGENVPTKPDPTITSDNISLPLYLDGSQDIMLAKADKIADTEGKEIAPANAYSAYSARKQVKPNLKFEHQLSRFVFNVVAGNDEGKKVKIKSVTLTSDDKADLVIADKNDDRGIKNPSGEGTFTLKDLYGNNVTSWFPKNVVGDGGQPYTFDKEEDQVGESIMVIPNNEPTEIKDRKHKLVILMRQMSAAEGGTELGEDFSYVYDLTPDMVVPAGDKFLPGYQYNVNVVVYGREKVLVSVQLTKWAEGGSITIDNDKEWGDEPKLGLKATKDNVDYYLYFYTDPIKAKTVGTSGTEVRVWDPADNTMIPAAPGTYKFADNQGTVEAPIWYVTLASEGEGENLKTVVTGLSAEEPTP